jgi:hypothetical protein
MRSPKLDTSFDSNPAKDFLRREYDKAIISQWRTELGKQLKYFGLPAWKMYDVIEWQQFIDRFTTIEREENQQHLMFLKANVENVEHRLHSLYGEFDDILLSGRDTFGHTPNWPYELVNLDYFGGFIYADLSRPKALRKLIQNQATYEQSFLFIITQQLRDRDTKKEKSGFLKDLGKSLKSGILDTTLHPSVDEVISWYEDADIPDCARQTLYMNYFLRDLGEAEHFDVACRPAIIYPGTGGSWMIHFVTDFRFQSGVGHRVASNQSLLELINLGLLEAREKGFVPTRFVQPKLSIHRKKNP